MIGTVEGDADVGAGSARGGVLRGRGGGRSPSLGAARNAPSGPADTTNDASFERQYGTAAQRDEQAAVVDEALDLREALPADAAGDVIGLGGSAEAGSFGSLFERHGAPSLGETLDLFGQ